MCKTSSKVKLIYITLARLYGRYYAVEMPNVFREGWLEKQGSQVKTWKKRWFVLNKPEGDTCYVLTYYATEKKVTEKVIF